MTTEVVVMNKYAVALAADSAVTISQSGNNAKVYNSVNKLFALSKHGSVAVMVYGAAELIGVPWETIIKSYRQDIATRTFDTVHEYANSFISYIEQKAFYISDEIQSLYFKRHVSYVLLEIFFPLEKRLREAVIDEHIVQHLIRDLGESLANFDQKLKAQPRLENMDDHYVGLLTQEVSSNFTAWLKELFNGEPLQDYVDVLCSYYSQHMSSMVAEAFVRKCAYTNNKSGIVIAGFGDNEIFPSVISYEIEGMYWRRLKYWSHQEAQITIQNQATIVPFAQSDVIGTFIHGIHPEYAQAIDATLANITSGYPGQVYSKLRAEGIDDDICRKIATDLFFTGEERRKRLVERFAAERNLRHARPVIEAVGFLPKEELAQLAESLINLTSVKRRMSPDTESVGGPADVAVITKGDGFIWIKRKHYFDANLNHQFFANYYGDGR